MSEALQLTAAGDLLLGSAVTAEALAATPAVQQRFAVLAEAAAQSRGSISEAVLTADARSHLLPALVVLGAWVRLAGPSGEREVPVEYLHAGPACAQPQPDERVASVWVPAMPRCSGGAFVASGAVGVAAVLVFAEDYSRLTQVRLSLTGQIRGQSRARAAEAALEGHAFEPAYLEAAAQAVADDLAPELRLPLAAVQECLREAVTRAAERARLR